MNAEDKKVNFISDIQVLNEKNIFLIYNGKSNKNLLIVSACRGSAYAYYFSQVTDYNVYMIYIIPFIIDKNLLDENKIKDIVQKTDIIVCETITNHSPFKTVEQTDPTSFFSIFCVDFNKVKIYPVPNLELHYHSHRLFHKHHISSSEELIKYYENSKKNLFNKCDLYQFHKTKKFIELHFKDLQLFHTEGHPTVITMLVLFIDLCDQLGINIELEDIVRLIKVNFLGNHEQPVFNLDVVTYGITYKVTIQDDILFNEKDLLVINDPSHLQTCENAKLIYDFFKN